MSDLKERTKEIQAGPKGRHRTVQVTVGNVKVGVDITVDELRDWIAEHKQELIVSLLDGTYRPQPVRGVEIPKSGGGVRQLGGGDGHRNF